MSGSRPNGAIQSRKVADVRQPHSAVIYALAGTWGWANDCPLQFQKRKLREYCSDVWNLEIINEFEDDWKSKTQGLIDALAYAESHLSAYDRFCMWDARAFTHHAMQARGMLFRLRQRGVILQDARRAHADEQKALHRALAGWTDVQLVGAVR